MQFTASLGLGFLLGILNWALWSSWAGKLLKQKKINWGAFFGISILKLGILATLIWFLLEKKYIDPIGFLAGFSVVIVLTIFKGVKWGS